MAFQQESVLRRFGNWAAGSPRDFFAELIGTAN